MFSPFSTYIQIRRHPDEPPLSPTHYQQPKTPEHPPPSARHAERYIHERIRPLSQVCDTKNNNPIYVNLVFNKK